MQGLFALGDGVVQFVDDLGAVDARAFELLETPLAIGVDHDSIGPRPQVGAIAGGDQQAEMLVPAAGGVLGLVGRRVALAAIVRRRLEGEFLGRR